MEILTLNEFIEILQKLQEEGYGDKELMFDEHYAVTEAVYDKNKDKISIN